MALIICPECKKQISETIDSCPHCGYKFSEGETKNLKEKQQKNTIIGLVIVAVIIIGLFKLCSGGGDKKESSIPWYEEDHSAGAWVYTQTYVENNLKSPRSAKFPWGYSDYVKRDGTTYTINSYVDSENSFGAMIRTYFNAKVKETNKDEWLMLSFEFVE